jgi:hypothetical protein
MPGVAPKEAPEVVVWAVAAAPAGITIAGNDPHLPLVYAYDPFIRIAGSC